MGDDVGELLRKVPPHPLKTLYQFFGEIFSGSVLHKRTAMSIWGPYPLQNVAYIPNDRF